MAFGLIDYVVFGSMLFISAAIGTFYRFTGGKQKTDDEYLLGDRNQNPILVAVSLMASFMSSISILGGDAEVFNYGTHFYTINIGCQIGILIAMVCYVPVFLKLESVSMYQYLELRFGKTLRIVSSSAFIVQMILYMSIVLVAPSIALQIITQMPYVTCILIVGFVCTFYSTIGGIKAVILTDLFQGSLMFISLFCVFITAYLHFGGFSKVFEIARDHGRLDFGNFSFDPTVRHSWFSTLVGGAIQGITLNGINQTQIQRYRTLKNRKAVNRSILYFGPIMIALSLCTMMTGLIVFARYHDCDPQRSGKILKTDQVLPLYVIDNFELPGLSGLFVAGIFSAALSTISPLLNSLAAVTVEDYFKPIYFKVKGKQFKQKTSIISQILSLTYGSLCIIIALLTLNMKSMLTAAIVVFNVVGGPILGMFSLGIFVPLANQWGTLVGFISGLIVTSWISIGQPRPPPVPLPTRVDGCPAGTVLLNQTTPILGRENYPYLFRISYLFYGVIGFSVTFFLGILFSLIFRSKNEKKIEPELLHELVAGSMANKKTELITTDNTDDVE
ncbi:putative sodium-dependent multivitamin transporter isoform X1 [Planococcus citri]|uniref:putative sodium-dependent multivitamin transporter isoform X1 n=2 Tax=Planococcus citri TaxID=170843 RepID=UPI0031F9E34B